MEKVSQIADKLRQEILEEEYGRQGMLPSRIELAERFQVTTDVINDALNQLLAEGLLPLRDDQG